MKRTMIVAGALVLGAGAVMAQQEIAVQQDNLMRAIAKNQYGVLQKMSKGDIPFDKKAADEAIASIEADVAKIAKTFEINPKQDVVNATYGSSPKVWQNKADFDAKIPPVQKAIADAKGKITNVAGLKAAYTAINDRCNDCHETYRVKLK
ncbi:MULTISPECIES: cytochrome c [Bradyrhizobium]|uniref:Cytochrome C555 n=1 Tax=Bradyrhizobium yuanmingense TaxID=108015 RepID=A0A0R3CAC2_9BRAD|nr:MULTISPECIES: cytochrome c [Bradyrhizobium]MCA1382934.1 cytochrome c [Bradyrhizobium sp. BRP05]KRP93324.1 cytochrome C555 [Bradyrhizobium yuanmingense]MCA1375141.1 cytochrome c [Bradyrhizobium sp. IC4060]MCA1422841.1 cytochrome c [Bradyrhizobium sp. BRP23]MCA1429840.1 cytochrome c [Bradyrhizobium sp. NBAIM16]